MFGINQLKKEMRIQRLKIKEFEERFWKLEHPLQFKYGDHAWCESLKKDVKILDNLEIIYNWIDREGWVCPITRVYLVDSGKEIIEINENDLHKIKT